VRQPVHDTSRSSGGGGGAAAAVVASGGMAQPALAADGDALILGVTNEATTPRGEDRRVIPNEMVSVTLPPNVPSKTRTSSMTRRLSRVALVGAAVTSLVLTGMGIAQAAELITKQSCEADGGTFAVKDGYRQCTKVITYTESLGISPSRGPDETDEQLGTVYYVGETEYFIVIRYTTVTRQRGNETPSLTGGDEILDSWTEERCYLNYSGGAVLVDNSECQSRGLFPAS
jgi:hypothetical protein